MVVVADDDRATCERISQLLRARGLVVVPANDGQKAIDAVRAQPVDLVVLDVDMPGLNGIDTCRVVKTITKDRFVPVVILAAPGDLSPRVQGLRTGADDHVTKPFEDSELLARIENMLRVKRAHDDVQFAKNELRYTPMHDELRKLPDHRFFHECIAIEFDEAQRHLDPLACCILAVDDFRELVSEHGAEIARDVLDEVSKRVQRTIRATDIAAQFRTAEFGLLLPNTRPARALTLADRIVSEVALRPFEPVARSPESAETAARSPQSAVPSTIQIDLTISIGVGLYPSGSIRSHSELLDAASIAVARARVAGPNRVCVVQQQGYIFRPTLPGAA
ncbi:MAG: response regulator [Deltaproteobacteria bacterium]|nr:response regulator [Deltaproteobacteria bacterium]MBW2213975.1 response regulator [Deltaproteobacteria bacterium]MBW2626702.1 response regulator [Deltaproteobacteria bacterium]